MIPNTETAFWRNWTGQGRRHPHTLGDADAQGNTGTQGNISDRPNPPQTPDAYSEEENPLPDWREIWERCKQRKTVPAKIAFREDRLIKTALLQYSARRIAKDSFAKVKAQLEGDGVLRITLQMETCWMMLCRGSEIEGVYGHFMRCLTLADEFDIFPVSDTQFELVFELQAFEKSALEEQK